VAQVLLGVGVEEALGVIAGVGEDAVHLLIEVAALVGHVHGQAVAVHGVDDAAGGDLRLEQADPMALHYQPLLHGLKEGHWGLCVGVSVACHSSLRAEKLLVHFRSDQPFSQCLLHGEPLVLLRVNDVASGSLCLQQHQGCPWPQDALPHGLVDAHLLLARLDEDSCDEIGALEELLNSVVLCHLLGRDASLLEALEHLNADDARVQQVPAAHPPSQPWE
ncbi:hypothetical protein N310_03036, partial [Acanthisitta chloris]